MKKLLISYDKVAKLYGSIIEVENLAAFKRDLKALLLNGNKQSNLERFPGDYDFIELGSYNNVTGEIKQLTAKAFLFNAGDLLDLDKSGEDNNVSETKEN